MGALSNSRKRTAEYCSVNNPHPFANYYPKHQYQAELLIYKRPRLSPAAAHNNNIVLVSKSSGSVSRLSRYPGPTSEFRRGVHAPCRNSKFWPKSSSDKNQQGAFGVEGTSSMGNAKSSFAGTRSHLFNFFGNKKEIVHVKPDADEKIVISDDSNVEVIEDGHEGVSVISDQGVQETNELTIESENLGGEFKMVEAVPSSSVVSDRTRVEDPVRMLDSLSLSPKSCVDSIPVHKKLYESASRSDFKLSRLRLEISLQESNWKSLILSRPVKKQVVEETAYSAISKEPFVPLTEAEENAVSKALSDANRPKVLVTHEDSNIEITVAALQCLRPAAWLNDEVINLYLQLLKERERRHPKKFLKCHFFNTFFYKKLITGRIGYDYKSVRRWTTQKKLGYGLIECDKIFVPIHKEVHWCLAVINKQDKKFQYLDSLGGKDSRALKVLARYYAEEVKDKSAEEIDVSSWKHEFISDLPAQENGWDCGVFMIKYADFYSRGLGLDFSQEHMPYFRVRTAKEILQLRAD